MSESYKICQDLEHLVDYCETAFGGADALSKTTFNSYFNGDKLTFIYTGRNNYGTVELKIEVSCGTDWSYNGFTFKTTQTNKYNGGESLPSEETDSVTSDVIRQEMGTNNQLSLKKGDFLDKRGREALQTYFKAMLARLAVRESLPKLVKNCEYAFSDIKQSTFRSRIVNDELELVYKCYYDDEPRKIKMTVSFDGQNFLVKTTAITDSMCLNKYDEAVPVDVIQEGIKDDTIFVKQGDFLDDRGRDALRSYFESVLQKTQSKTIIKQL